VLINLISNLNYLAKSREQCVTLRPFFFVSPSKFVVKNDKKHNFGASLPEEKKHFPFKASVVITFVVDVV
jgi:hypothetical protein